LLWLDAPVGEGAIEDKLLSGAAGLAVRPPHMEHPPAVRAITAINMSVFINESPKVNVRTPAVPAREHAGSPFNS